jgi:Opacity family porin protein
MKTAFFSKFFASSLSRTVILLAALSYGSLFSSSAQAQEKRNDAGVAIQFGNGTNFGIQGKLGLSDNFSLRPEIFFGGGSSIENKPFQSNRAFNVPQAFAAPAGITTSIPGPANLTTSATLSTSVTTPTNFTTTTAFSTNVPITVAGNTIPAGSNIPVGTVVPAGTVIPAGFTLPAGTPIPAGTSLPIAIPAGTNIPAGTPIPIGTSFPAGLIGSRLSGTSFGVAATYDFKLDPQGKSTAYIGPKLAFASSSGPATFNGADIPGSNLNVSETKIGLVAGADYGVSDNFTIGANVTYNLSNSVNASGSINYLGISDIANNVRSTGSSLDFGVRASYRF